MLRNNAIRHRFIVPRGRHFINRGFQPPEKRSNMPSSPVGTTLFQRIIPIVALFITAGCSSTFNLSVRNALANEPMEDVWIERTSEHWYAPFVFAPGATFRYVASSNRTDQAGTIIYKGNPKEKDWFILHMPTNIPWDTPLYVKIGDVETKVDVKSRKIKRPQKDNTVSYWFSISKQKKELYYSVHFRDVNPPYYYNPN